eukprot:m.12069 g.12069  ORF g.12069 m.12069 type:complete len:122 (-) comp7949_c0_seq2:190-555(-)
MISISPPSPPLNSSELVMFALRRLVLVPSLRRASSDYVSRIRQFPDKFGEANMEVQDAHSSKGTVYFSQDAEEAAEMVREVQAEYDALVKDLPAEEKDKFTQQWQMRIRELQERVETLAHD